MDKAAPQAQYELKVPTGKTTAIFLISLLVFWTAFLWALLRAMGMGFRDFFSVSWAQPLIFVTGMLAMGPAFAVNKVWGKPDRVRIVLDDDSISTILLGTGGQELKLLKRVAFTDVEGLWFPASGNMLILRRRRRWLLSLACNIFDRKAMSSVQSLVADLKVRIGVQETLKRHVWWPPLLGGTEYRNPGFKWREIPLAVTDPVSDSKFVALWILATGLGLLLGLIGGAIATVVVNELSDASIGESSSIATAVGVVLAIVAGALVTGSITGAFQGRVLSRRLMAKVRWAAATTAGLVCAVLVVGGIVLGVALSSSATQIFSNISGLLQVAAGGLLVGAVWSAFQWLVVRRYVSKATRWILVNAGVSAAIASALYLVLSMVPGGSNRVMDLIDPFRLILGLFVGGIIWSVTTGMILVRLIPASPGHELPKNPG